MRSMFPVLRYTYMLNSFSTHARAEARIEEICARQPRGAVTLCHASPPDLAESDSQSVTPRTKDPELRALP
jgi:hypothetical protein